MTIAEPTPPFGAFAPTSWESRIIAITRAMPEGWAGKRAALLFRKLVKRAMARPVDVEVFGCKMRLNGLRNIAERRLLIQPQHFDPLERRLLKEHLRPGDVAVDAGANIGAYALLMGGMVGPAGRVIAIEPQPAVLARLKCNLAFNPDLKIETVETALGGAAGQADFEISEDNEGESRLGKAGHSSIRVPVTTLQSLLEDRGVTGVAALKIDVEGAEPQILIPFFNHAPRSLWPRLIVLERVNQRWDVDLVAILRSQGYAEAAATRLNAVLRLPG